MKKLLLLVGVSVGFVVGSRAGKAPYQRLRNTLREVAGRPEVKQAVDAASEKWMTSPTRSAQRFRKRRRR